MKEENEVIIRCLNKYGRVPETYELLNIIEAYENIRKELKEYIKNCIGMECKEDLLNVLNKVGEDNE